MGKASEDSVKVVGGRRVDLAEQSVCVSELVERRKRVKFDDFGSNGAQFGLELAGGSKVSL